MSEFPPLTFEPMYENIPINIIFPDNKNIYLMVPNYYTINDIINDLIIIYKLNTDDFVYSLHFNCVNCLCFSTEINLNPATFVFDLEYNEIEENYLVLRLSIDSKIFYFLKNSLHNIFFKFNWI